jgi:hypothetical protein
MCVPCWPKSPGHSLSAIETGCEPELTLKYLGLEVLPAGMVNPRATKLFAEMVNPGLESVEEDGQGCDGPGGLKIFV